MALTPANPTITTAQTQPFSSGISNGLPSATGGSLVQGGSATEYIYSPSGAGTFSVKVTQKPDWPTYNAAHFSKDETTRRLTVVNADNDRAAFAEGTLENIGDYFDHVISDTNGFIELRESGGAVKNNLEYFTQFRLQNSASSGSYGSSARTFGDTIRTILVSNGMGGKVARIIKNPNTDNVTVATGTETYTALVGRIYVFGGTAAGKIINPFSFSNAPSEQTNITVTGTETEKVWSFIF